MSKPYTESDLSDIFDAELTWRRKELSDVKAAIKSADSVAQSTHLRALVTISYAHWEGYVRACANRYFQHLTLRRKSYADFERQIYVNRFLGRLDGLCQARVGLTERCELVNEILDGGKQRFAFINSELIDAKSNLSTDVVNDICLICGVESGYFENKRTFIDKLLLKRRNSIAHGQQELISSTEADGLVREVLALMEHFRTLLENKVYTQSYVA